MKNTIQSLRCGGKKKDRKAEGGIIGEDQQLTTKKNTTSSVSNFLWRSNTDREAWGKLNAAGLKIPENEWHLLPVEEKVKVLNQYKGKFDYTFGHKDTPSGFKIWDMVEVPASGHLRKNFSSYYTDAKNNSDKYLKKQGIDPDSFRQLVTDIPEKKNGGLVTMKNGGIKKGKMKKFADGSTIAGIIQQVASNSNTGSQGQIDTKDLKKLKGTSDTNLSTQLTKGVQKAENEELDIKEITGSESNAAGGSGLGAAIGTSADMTTQLLEAFKKDPNDNRVNPYKSARTNALIGNAQSAMGSTGSGASGSGDVNQYLTLAMGSAGTSLGLISALLKEPDQKEQLAEIANKWSADWNKSTMEGMAKRGYKSGGSILRTFKGPAKFKDDITEEYAEGGKIEGSGGPKSDSIVKKVEDGSFIVPAENAKTAMSYGKEYLGWLDKEQANRNYPGTKVKLSNGEVLFTPEEVGILEYHGVDLESLAPNAKESIEKGGSYKDGTDNDGPTYDKFRNQYITNTPNATEDDIMKEWNSTYGESYGVVKRKSEPEKKTFLQSLGDMIPEIAGAIQAGAATAGIAKAGRMPDINVSSELKQLAIQARKEAEYGLDPGAKNAMLNAAENARRDTTNAIVNRGGSSAEIMANLQGQLSTTIGEKYKAELMDVSEKARKQNRVDSLVTAIAGQDMDVQKVALMNWKDIQESNAGLLSAGISNIVGARKLKAEMESMDAIKKKGQLFINIGGKSYPLDNSNK